MRAATCPILLVAVLGLFLSAPRAAEPGAPEVVAKLQAWIDGTRDLACKFEQALVSGAFGTDLIESGRLWVSRPGRIRWDYLDPEKKTALLVGDRTLLYLADDRQMIRGKLEPDQAALPELLVGRRRLADVFDAAIAPRTKGEGDEVRLRLVPRSKSEGLTEVILLVRPPEYGIEGAEVLDGMGNRTSYRFASVRRNRGLDEALFRFEPPAGTQIVDQ